MTYRITGIIRERKISRIVNLFQFARKRSRIQNFLVQLFYSISDQHLCAYFAEYIDTCHTHFFQRRLPLQKPYKVVCTNAVAIADTPICNCSIVSFFQNSNNEVLNIQLEAQKTSNPHLSDLHWNAYRSLPGSSAITTLCLRPSTLSRNKLNLEKMKIQQENIRETPGFAKFANIFFREQFPLYGTLYTSYLNTTQSVNPFNNNDIKFTHSVKSMATTQVGLALSLCP